MTPRHALAAGTTAALCGAAAALVVTVLPEPAGLLAAAVRSGAVRSRHRAHGLAGIGSRA